MDNVKFKCNLKIRGEWRLDQELGEILVKMSSTRECGELQGYCCEGDVQGGLPRDGGLQLELLLKAGRQEGHPAVLCYLLLQPSPDGGGGRHWLLLEGAGVHQGHLAHGDLRY